MPRHTVTALLTATASVALVLGGTGVSSAQSEIPGSTGQSVIGGGSVAPLTALGSVRALAGGSPVEEPPAVNLPVGPYEATGFLTPDRPEFWNPLVSGDRLVSPFGTSTRIRCTSFHGVTLQCWQDDREGQPHRLVELTYNYPSSAGAGMPGGGPGTYVYADPAGWATGS